MEVYIEVVILDNFLLDYLLLSSVSVFLPPCSSRIRRIGAATMGTAYAVLSPLREFGVLRILPIKLGVGCMMVFCAFEWAGRKRYFKRCAVFFCLGFVLGGMLLGVGFLLGMPTAMGGGYIVTGVPLWVLLPISYGFVKGCEVLSRCVKTAMSHESRPVTVQFSVYGKEYRFPGLVDSGNLLTIPGTGIPIIVCMGNASLIELCKERKLDTLQVTASSIGGATEVTVFCPEAVYLVSGQKKAVTAAIGLCDGPAIEVQALVPIALI